MKICPACTNKNEDEAKICSYCGELLVDVSFDENDYLPFLRPVGIWTYVCYGMGVLFFALGIRKVLEGDLSTGIISMLLGLAIPLWPWYKVKKTGFYGEKMGVPIKRRKRK